MKTYAVGRDRLIELGSSERVRYFEYDGLSFRAFVSAETTGNNGDRMKISLVTVGQECSGELVIEGNWERDEFFDLMRDLANRLSQCKKPSNPWTTTPRSVEGVWWA